MGKTQRLYNLSEILTPIYAIMTIYRNKLKSLLWLGMTATALTASAQRTETVLRDGWKFSRGEKYATMSAIAPSLVGFNDRNWQTV